MSVAVRKGEIEGEVTIAIDGRFDFSDHTSFRQSYDDEDSGAKVHKYVVDLRGTDYMDSSALGMLLLLREHAENNGQKTQIVGCSDEIKKILTLSNFDKMFDIK